MLAQGTTGSEAPSRRDWQRRSRDADSYRRDRGRPGHRLVQWARSLWQSRRESARREAHQGGTLSHRPEGGGEALGLMGARLDTVAKFVCEQSGWRVSQLTLQKLIYLAQVEFLGENERRLVDTTFEAWNLGPVSPNLYHKVKVFGAAPVKDVFYDARVFTRHDPRREKLDSVCDRFLGKRPGDLIEITHWDFGAWAQKYEPNVRGVQITDDDILREYRNRERYAATWRRIAA